MNATPYEELRDRVISKERQETSDEETARLVAEVEKIRASGATQTTRAGILTGRMAAIDELGPEARAAFREQMEEAGVAPTDEQRRQMADSVPCYDDLPTRRFLCIGRCWQLGCECKNYDGSTDAPTPPLHGGCHCVVSDTKPCEWLDREGGLNRDDFSD